MKIQNSEGHIVEVPRHLRKKIKQMLDNNQHEEVTQMFADGGKIKPYVTNDPNDPRIQAYRDSSEKFMNGYHELQVARNKYKQRIDAFSYRADKYLTEPEKIALKGVQATKQRYNYKPEYTEKYWDGNSLGEDLKRPARALGKTYVKDPSYEDALNERGWDEENKEKNMPIGYTSVGDSRYLNAPFVRKDAYNKHIKPKVNTDITQNYVSRQTGIPMSQGLRGTIDIDQILKRRAGFDEGYKSKERGGYEYFDSDAIPQYQAPKQQVIYNGPKPEIKETITTKTVNKVKPVSRTKTKPVSKPVEQPIVQQVTPESQTQINTGKEDTTKLGFRTDSTGKRHYRVNGKDVPEKVYKNYEKLKHKKVEYRDGGLIDTTTYGKQAVNRGIYGLGGTIGSLLQAAAPIAGLIPGVGTLVGAAAGVVGNGLQQLDSGQKWDPTQTIGAGIQGATGMKVPGKMAQGGMTGLVPVNIEGHDVNSISMAKAKKGELLVNSGNIIKNYISRPPHPKKGQNPLGDDEVQPGSIVIPKNRSQEYLNAGRALRKQIEASVVSQQVARESNMMRKGGQAGRSKMLPGGMAKDYFDREYPYAPSLNPNVNSTQVQDAGPNFMLGDPYTNARQGLPASYNNMNPMTPRDPFNSGYDQNIRTQMSNNNNNPGPRGSIYNRTDGGTPGEQDSGMSSFDKLNLGQFGLSMIPAIGDIIDATASVQTPQFGSLRNVSPNLLDPNTGQSQINQAYRSGYNSLRDSGVYSLKSNRNLVADRMQRSGDQALNIANQNAQIKNQFVGMNTDINKYNLDMQNQVELYRMQGQAKRREARRNLLDRAPAAASQYMQNGLYAKMLGI